jgi:hypothetical protein
MLQAWSWRCSLFPIALSPTYLSVLVQYWTPLRQDLPSQVLKSFRTPKLLHLCLTYDDASQTMISYDTLQVVSQKVEYIKVRHLGGAMWWETSGDQPSSSNNSLMNSAAESLGKYGNNEMEKSEDCLECPQSK